MIFEVQVGKDLYDAALLIASFSSRLLSLLLSLCSNLRNILAGPGGNILEQLSVVTDGPVGGGFETRLRISDENDKVQHDTRRTRSVFTSAHSW